MKKERKRKDLDAWSRIFTQGNIDITGILLTQDRKGSLTENECAMLVSEGKFHW